MFDYSFNVPIVNLFLLYYFIKFSQVKIDFNVSLC